MFTELLGFGLGYFSLWSSLVFYAVRFVYDFFDINNFKNILQCNALLWGEQKNRPATSAGRPRNNARPFYKEV